MTPTEKSIRLLKSRGYQVVERVEHWNSFAKCRQDLFGFADLIAVGTNILLIQTTSYENFSARKKKILASTKAPVWLRARGTIELHSWKKGDCKNPRIEFFNLGGFKK